MKKEKLQPLPLGTSNFGALRKAGQIYVDKTDLVYEMASKRGKFFLSRPRRFGKTLLISTFESLFKHGLRDFRGLAIEKLWNEKPACKILRFDFSRVKAYSSIEAFCQAFDDYLSDLMLREQMKAPAGMRGVRAFDNWLALQPLNSVVILIDEYDAPLTSSLDNPELFHQVRNRLSEFYGLIKELDGPIQFLFITGITKFNKTSIFSELNNLTDISLDPLYGKILGYTEKEVKEYFGEHLKKANVSLNLSERKLIEHLRNHYDGFCFDEEASAKVFNPWSTLKFLDRPERGFRNYWFESGGKPSVLVHYMNAHSLKNPESYGMQQAIALSTLENSSDLETLSDVGLLTQTGYLTIKKVVGSTAYVDYPNAEVRTSMAQLYIEQVSGGKTAEEAGVDNVARRLAVESAESIVALLGRMLEAIDYQNYPIRDEASVRAFVQVYLAGAGLDPRAEVHGSHGRSDLEVEAGNRLWVFEFKVKREDDNDEALLREALEQMKLRRYGEAREAEERLRVALVFSLEERRFVRWAVCPEPQRPGIAQISHPVPRV